MSEKPKPDLTVEDYFKYCAYGILATVFIPIIAIGAVVLFPFYLIGRAVDK